ncbi:Gfo/Idh/MocA family oxidoreductase [Microbacterium thalassium]|uniref:Gfo/Idh/MocA family protein n=1 Tax=Microbacterium TaxID=33882 RepID=UPI00146CB858|nr:Gfo/Idh/MocA family oxidoreductase [Microbacterium thalassium]
MTSLRPAANAHTPARTAAQTVGIIGAGVRGRTHLLSYQRLGVPTTVVSRMSAPELVKECGWGVAAADTDELFASCDVVDICAPTGSHADLARAAINAGKHVIVEMPLTGTVEDADDLLRLADARGVRLLPAHVCRYQHEYAHARGQALNGALGAVESLTFFRRTGSPVQSGWWSDPERRSDVLGHLAIHDIDMALWVAGPVKSVSAIRSAHRRGDAALDVSHVLMQHLSGTVTRISAIWGPPQTPLRSAFSFVGDRGRLTHRSDKGAALEWSGNLRERQELVPAFDAADPVDAQLSDFLQAIESGRDARVAGFDGREAVRVANAARDASRLRSDVQIADAALA